MHYTQNLFNTSCACIESVPFVSPSLRIKQRPLYASLYWTMYCISLQSAQRYATDSSIATWIDNFTGVAHTHTPLSLLLYYIHTYTYSLLVYMHILYMKAQEQHVNTHAHTQTMCMYLQTSLRVTELCSWYSTGIHLENLQTSSASKSCLNATYFSTEFIGSRSFKPVLTQHTITDK